MAESEASELLYESEHQQVLYSPLSPSDVLVFTFNELGFTADGRNFWGKDFLRRHGFAAIGIASKRPNWFPADDLRRAADVVRQRLAGTSFRCRLSYGFSQGGYGALKFGALFGIDVALAISPQWSIAPDDVASFDPRYVGLYEPMVHGPMAIQPADLPTVSYVLFDRWATQDAGHIAKLAGMPGVREVIIPFAGHETIRLLVQAGLMKPLFDIALSADGNAAAMRRAIRDRRGVSYIYWSHRNWHLAHHLPKWQRAREKTRAALAEFHESALSVPSDDFLTRWRQLMQEAGPEMAAAYAASEIAKSPERNGVRVHLVRSLIDCQKNEEALSHLGLLWARAGTDRWVWGHLQQAFDRLGRSAEAAEAGRVLASLN